MGAGDPKEGAAPHGAAQPAPPAYAGKILDATPPEDYQQFLDARRSGLKANRAKMERRRKRA